MQDKLEKERNDAKNAVEEYVYDFRDKLGTVYGKFVTQEVSLALANWLSRLESYSLHQEVLGSIPNHSIYGSKPIDVSSMSLILFLPHSSLPLYLSKNQF